MYRREQQWKVFSWISSLLLAIIGGVIAISENSTSIANINKVLLTLAVLIFAFFGVLRLRRDASVAKFYANKYYELDKLISAEFIDKSHKHWHLGHTGFLLLMAIVTLGVIWLPIT